MQNPLLLPFKTTRQTPPFHLIAEEHYKPAFEQAITQGKADIAAILNNNEAASFANTIEALDNAGRLLSDVSEVFFNLNHANTNDNMQKIAREVSPWLTEYSNDIWLNDKLFAKVKMVYDTCNKAALRPDQQKLLDDTYKAFVRKGALLNNEDKKRYREITTRLSDLSLQFGENVLAETNDFKLHLTNVADLDGLPEGVIEAAAQLAKSNGLDGWLFTLHFPSYMPFMKYAKNRELRKQLFLAYSKRANQGNKHDNNAIVAEIVALRAEKAKLLGSTNHAAYVLEERMAQSVDRVMQFLQQLLNAALPYAKRDIEDLQQLASSMGFSDTLQRWDFAFYSEILKANKFSVDDEAIKPYFELGAVQKNIFGLATDLFGITFQPSESIPVYHPDVKAYEVLDKDGTFLSVLYLDFFPRPSKQNGAWMTAFREQRIDNGIDVRPVVSLVMNFSMPTETKPSLLTFNEVQTFLHEFGHALHGMFSKVKYSSQAGTNVYRDFVELPSQWLENWATDKLWLQKTALHYQTGQAIPPELIDKLIESDNFQSGYATIRQLSFGLLDMAYHTMDGSIAQNEIAGFERRAIAPTELLPLVDGTCISTAFSHIFNGGYAAGYYGYKWAEVLDADAFELFKQNGVYHAQTANSFRTNILERGGSAHPMYLYVAFRGQEPTVDALLKRSGLK
jgi:peptidyl-dipeptidase Dcp